jgi:glycosyltransferase involved in cell wall biosynthesis
MPATQAAGPAPDNATPEVGNMAPDSILVPARDVDALAKAMLQLATDPALRSRLGEAARQNYLKLHPWDEFIDTLTQIYTGEQSEN